jgi:hypothetical protein
MSVLENLTNATMTFEKAKKEFEIRYYLWAISEWEKEINESFPNLRSFKAGTIWKTYQFMQLLNKSEQLILARGLLKRFHSEAVKILGENCSPEEESLRRKRDEFFRIRQQYQYIPQLGKNGQFDVAQFWIKQLRAEAANIPGVAFFDDDKSLLSQLDAVFRRIPLTFEEQIAARKQAGEKIKFASKRKLQKAITEKFKAAFGDQCIDHRFDDEHDLSSNFDIKCCGWILSTHFWFGRRESLINYSHGIGSETRITHPESKASASAMVMAQMVSFSSWLGITSQIQWEYLMNEEIESACDAVIKLCRHFFEVAPKLLKGLEFEK